MYLKLIAAAALLAVPLAAQAQQRQKPPKATNAEAQRVVKMISADKAKTKAYCDMAKIGNQIDAAQQKHDLKTADELSQKASTLADQIGPEWNALIDGLQGVDENSKEGQAIGNTLDGLDKLCN